MCVRAHRDSRLPLYHVFERRFTMWVNVSLVQVQVQSYSLLSDLQDIGFQEHAVYHFVDLTFDRELGRGLCKSRIFGDDL